MSKSKCQIVVSILLSLLLLAPKAYPIPSEERHPVLLYEAEDLPRIRENASRAPYDAWWRAVQEEADRALGIEVQGMGKEMGTERRKTEYAKVLAFAYAFTEEVEYAQKAAEFLTSVAFPPDGGEWGEMHFEAEGAASFHTARAAHA